MYKRQGQVGAVHDILDESSGHTHIVARADAISAKELIESTEGIDIMTPGAVAAASLLQAIKEGSVEHDDCILLNISGGGVKRLKQEIQTRQVEPWLRVKKANAVAAIIRKIKTD